MSNPDDTDYKKVSGGKFLTFFLRNEEFGIEILKVQEIIGLMEIRSVPKTPEFIRGIINLRGKITPILDLRLKFGMECTEPTEQTCIIVLNTKGLEMGVIVDRVSEVVNITSDEISDPPSFGVPVDTNYILGIGKTSKQVKILLDIDQILSSQEILYLNSMPTGKHVSEEEI